MAWKLIKNKTRRDGTGEYTEQNTQTGARRTVVVSPEYLERKRSSDGARCFELIRSSQELGSPALAFETGAL